jgi:hypothetical protein
MHSKRSYYYFPLIFIIPVWLYGMLHVVGPTSDWMQLCKALIWGICIAQACYGFGWFFCFIVCKLHNQAYLYCPVGIGFLCGLGSLFNYCEIVKPMILVAVIVMGVCIFAIANISLLDFLKRAQLRIHSLSIYTFCVGICLSLVYLASFGDLQFNLHDDYHAYLVGPVKMLQTGSLGPDPFSERRLVSGYGGNAMLLAYMLSGSNMIYLHALDWGVGKLMLLSVIFLYAIRSRLTVVTIVMMLGVILMLPPAVNLTVMIVPMTLILGAWLLIWELATTVQAGHLSDVFKWKYVSILSLILSGLISLKTSFIPLAIMTVCIFTYFSGISWKAKLLHGGAAIFLISLLTVFWALELFTSSHTLLYPLLGKGVHGSVYGYFNSPLENFFSLSHWRQSLSDWVSPYFKTLGLLVAATVGVSIYPWGDVAKAEQVQLNVIRALLLGTLIYVGLIGVLLGGYGTYRFIYFALIASIIAGILFLYPIAQKTAHLRQYLILGATIFFCGYQFLAWMKSPDGWLMAKRILESPLLLQQGNLDVSKRSQEYLHLSANIPSQGLTLVRVDRPYLIDFQTHRNLMITDNPGAVSPPPGMPFQKGSQALQAYLLEQNIHFIVWDYQTQAGFNRSNYGDRLQSSANPWVKSQAEHAFDFQENLEVFRKTLPNLYDGHGFVIIDLRPH